MLLHTLGVLVGNSPDAVVTKENGKQIWHEDTSAVHCITPVISPRNPTPVDIRSIGERAEPEDSRRYGRERHCPAERNNQEALVPGHDLVVVQGPRYGDVSVYSDKHKRVNRVMVGHVVEVPVNTTKEVAKNPLAIDNRGNGEGKTGPVEQITTRKRDDKVASNVSQAGIASYNQNNKDVDYKCRDYD